MNKLNIKTNQKTLKAKDWEGREIQRAYEAEMNAQKITEADIRNLADAIVKKLGDAVPAEMVYILA